MKKSRSLLLAIIVLALSLRLYKISQFPPGLYSDEAAYGYNAYSLLKTGRDEYGKLWPLTFKNFGDYKPPMTAWLTIPFIALFGLNELAVRLPSVIAGTITVAIVYFLAQEIFPQTSLKIKLPAPAGAWQLKIGEIAALMLAISPWHLHFSRSSMLVAIEAMFISLGLLLFLQATKKPQKLYFAAISFSAAIYTYYGSRVSVPLLLIVLAAIYRRELWRWRATVVKSAILGALLLSPLIIAIAKDPATLTGRARTISVFYDLGTRIKLWQAHTLDGPDFPVLLSRFFHNKPYFYFREIAQRFFQHLSYRFWVVSGDTRPPFNIPNMGVVFLADIIFVFYGFYLSFRYRSQASLSLLAYLFVGPLIAAFTFLTPSANRSFNMVIGWTILTAVGIAASLKNLQKRPFLFKTSPVILLLVYLLSFVYYLHNYYVAIPQQIPQDWYYGRKQLTEKLSRLESKFNQVVFSRKEGPAYIWLLFYKQYSPQKYWQTAKVDPTFDELGWLHVEAFDKYVFPREFDWPSLNKDPQTLYVSYQDEIPNAWRENLNGIEYSLVLDDQVKYPNGKTAFKLMHFEAI